LIKILHPIKYFPRGWKMELAKLINIVKDEVLAEEFEFLRKGS